MCLQRAAQSLRLQLDGLGEGADPVLLALALEWKLSIGILLTLHQVRIAQPVLDGRTMRLVARHSLLDDLAFLYELLLSLISQLRLREPHLAKLVANRGCLVLQLPRHCI